MRVCCLQKTIQQCFEINPQTLSVKADRNYRSITSYLTNHGISRKCAKQIAQQISILFQSLPPRYLMTWLNHIQNDFIAINDQILSLLQTGTKQDTANAVLLLYAVVLSFLPCLMSKKYGSLIAQALEQYCAEETVSYKLAALHALYISLATKGKKVIPLRVFARYKIPQDVAEKMASPTVADLISRIASLAHKHAKANLIGGGDYESSIVVLESPQKTNVKLGGQHIIELAHQNNIIHMRYADHSPTRISFVQRMFEQFGCKVKREGGVLKIECPEDVLKEHANDIALLLVLTTSTDMLRDTLDKIKKGEVKTVEDLLRQKYREIKGREISFEEERELSIPF